VDSVSERVSERAGLVHQGIERRVYRRGPVKEEEKKKGKVQEGS
jgi:hypothetical protein